MTEDAVARYGRQLEMVLALRAAWADLGEPLTAEGGATGRAIVVHPLVLAIQDAEMKADRLWKSAALEKKGRGRPTGSTSAPDRKPKLRAVS